MKLRAYLALGRPSNLPTVWTDVLAGQALAAGPGAEVEGALTALMMAAMSLLYVGGMFLNDAFDADWDARERPERPIPAGRVSRREAYLVGFALLGLGLGLVALRAGLAPAAPSGSGPKSILAAAALAVAVVVYDARHKGSRVAPFVMGACRALVYLAAGAAVAGRFDPPLLLGAAALGAYVVGLTYVARQENLASFRGAWPLLFLAAPLGHLAGPLARGGGPAEAAVFAVFPLGFAVWAAYAVSRLLARRPGQIPRAVVALLAGISLADALAIAAAGAPATAALAALGLPATLGLQRYVRGT